MGSFLCRICQQLNPPEQQLRPQNAHVYQASKLPHTQSESILLSSSPHPTDENPYTSSQLRRMSLNLGTHDEKTQSPLLCRRSSTLPSHYQLETLPVSTTSTHIIPEVELQAIENHALSLKNISLDPSNKPTFSQVDLVHPQVATDLETVKLNSGNVCKSIPEEIAVDSVHLLNQTNALQLADAKTEETPNTLVENAKPDQSPVLENQKSIVNDECVKLTKTESLEKEHIVNNEVNNSDQLPTQFTQNQSELNTQTISELVHLENIIDNSLQKAQSEAVLESKSILSSDALVESCTNKDIVTSNL